MATLMELIGGAPDDTPGVGTDGMETLLPLLMAQGAAASEPTGDEGTMGMLAAMQASPFYSGQPSQSGVGQISESILPLITGLMAGKQAERVAKNNALVKQIELLNVGLKLSELSAKVKAASPAGQAARQQRAEAAGLEPAELDESGNITYKRPVAPKDSKYNLLRDSFRETNGRDPSATELKGMVQQFDSYNKAQQLQVIEDASQRKRLLQPAKPETGGRYFDPVTLKPAPASLLQGEAESGGYIPLPDVESRYVRTALGAFTELNKVDAAAAKLLTPSTGSATDIATVAANRARLAKLRAQGDPDARAFDSMQRLIVFPVTKVAQGSDRLSNVDQTLTSAALPSDGDTIQSAHAKTAHVRQSMIEGFIALGFDPDAVQAAAMGKPTTAGAGASTGRQSTSNAFNVDVPADLMPSALKLLDSMPNATDAEVGDALRKLVEGSR